jgi:hypothetical protein
MLTRALPARALCVGLGGLTTLLELGVFFGLFFFGGLSHFGQKRSFLRKILLCMVLKRPKSNQNQFDKVSSQG